MSGAGATTVEGGAAPMILTALLPPDLHARFTALRTAHFPPERNFLEAHVTLFHALPGSYQGEVADACRRLAAEVAPPPGRVLGIMSLGQGTAIRLESARLLALRERLAGQFHGLLPAQDQHRPRLHVTIQNKVEPRAAKALQAALADVIAPRSFAFRGLGLYRYRGGPWDLVKTFAFRGTAES